MKRLYVPLPGPDARRQIIDNLLGKERHALRKEDVQFVVSATEGYSGADMTNLCKDSAMGPIRSLDFSVITTIADSEVRAIEKRDFIESLRQIRPSVSEQDLELYLSWNAKFGCGK